MLSYVANATATQHVAVSNNDLLLAQAQRIDLSSLGRHIHGGGRPPGIREATDDRQASPGLLQKRPTLAASEYTETTTTSYAVDDHDQYSDLVTQPISVEIPHIDTSDGAAEPSDDEPDDDDGPDSSSEGFNEYSRSSMIPNREDILIAAMANSIGVQFGCRRESTHPDVDMDVRSYPETTSGRISDSLHSRPRTPFGAADIRIKQIPLSDTPTGQPSVPSTLDEEFPRVRRKREPCSDELPNEQRRLHAAFHKQQNVEAYYERLKQQTRPAEEDDIGPASSPKAVSRPQSVPAFDCDPSHDESSPARSRQHSQQMVDRSSHPAQDLLPVRLSPRVKEVSGAANADTSLDHDLADLKGMPYDVLKREAFDKASPTSTDNDQATASLEEKLEMMVTRSPNEQQDFFGGMTMSEWEQSGSWFSEQFARLMQRLQVSRQERRKLAEGFEDEISSYHYALVEEQHSLDDTLKEMRTSGNQVLHPTTPKRKR